jgi:hypothetical protein
MDLIVKDMFEDFIMSEACSRYYALGNEVTSDAQNVTLFINYTNHASLCKMAAKACVNYLENKNFDKLLLEFRMLDLNDHINVLRLEYSKIKQIK